MPPDFPDSLAELQVRLGLQFNEPSLLIEALTHASHAHLTGKRDNGRLSRLGFSVILLNVVECLYRTYEEESEGALDELRKQLSNDDRLAVIALELGLLEISLQEEGARKILLASIAKAQLAGKPIPSKVLCGLMKALVGAIYLDQGRNAASGFVIQRIVVPALPDEVVGRLDQG